MLQMALRRNNANVELVSGNVTQRTNEQLVEMAENQKMREMELMQTLLADTKPVSMDYNAEFAAREQEIEQAEKRKVIIVVDKSLQEHLKQAEVAKEKPSVTTPAAEVPPPADLKTTSRRQPRCGGWCRPLRRTRRTRAPIWERTRPGKPRPRSSPS